MRYCVKCGSRLDDFDSYCPNCGTKVEDRRKETFYDGNCNDNASDKRVKVEDAINDITETVSQNSESFLCILLGVLSLTFGTFICAIISLVFRKKAIEKGQDKDSKCATFCRVGKICSIISIVLTVVGIVLSIICWTLPLALGV